MLFDNLGLTCLLTGHLLIIRFLLKTQLNEEHGFYVNCVKKNGKLRWPRKYFSSAYISRSKICLCGGTVNCR